MKHCGFSIELSMNDNNGLMLVGLKRFVISHLHSGKSVKKESRAEGYLLRYPLL